MEDFRSKSCGDGRMQTESYNYNGHKPTPSNVQDFRCYSASHASSSSYAQPPQTQMEIVKDVKLKKGKSMNGSSKNWSFNDPELQRKKRVVSYKAYTVEGKVKGSFRKSFRWIKDRYNQMVYGWR
ncbi:uncharacterized protein LOC132277091 [Cornus florida]|uniref:uncharacterized protein LOC132277091 n=1 Tax=Cornus florida TaxID=4283 RepID=UPI00289E0DCD|nr:uncharacterized protein LOC132277091 [Cornus florida]